MVTPCRISPPLSIQFVSHRTSQRQNLLRPDALLVANILYILAYLQTRFALDYHAIVVLSDHLHLLLTDLLGDQTQAFNREFFSLLARSTNCYWGRSENLWNTSKPSCVLVAPRAEDLIARLVYIVNNPVAAGLVSHPQKWPGVLITPPKSGQRTMTVPRPKFFYDPLGLMPEEVTLTFNLPQAWDAEPDELYQRFHEESNRRGEEIRARFRKEGRDFMGAKRVKRQSPYSSPQSREAWFGLNPHVACKDTSLRVRFLRWRKERQRRYEEKRAAFRARQRDVVFPEGTYALHFVFGQRREEWKG